MKKKQTPFWIELNRMVAGKLEKTYEPVNRAARRAYKAQGGERVPALIFPLIRVSPRYVRPAEYKRKDEL